MTFVISLSPLSTYYIPRDGSIQTYLDYITLLPNIDRPEAFGQHPNADITSLISESRMLFETLMSLQIQSAESKSESKEDKVSALASDVLSKLPQPIDYNTTDKLIGAHKKPLDVVLLQEIQRYNALLETINCSLVDLQRGIAGLVVMSTELDEIFNCIYNGRVPPSWLKGGYNTQQKSCNNFFFCFSLSFSKVAGFLGSRFKSSRRSLCHLGGNFKTTIILLACGLHFPNWIFNSCSSSKIFNSSNSHKK